MSKGLTSDLSYGLWSSSTNVTVIHLNPVDAPSSVCRRILAPVVLAAHAVAHARARAAARVQPKRQVRGVNVVRDNLHAVGEVVALRVGGAVGVALGRL